jgi:hypothetical protein
MARREVDDAQPPHTDGASTFGVETFIVRSAMAH